MQKEASTAESAKAETANGTIPTSVNTPMPNVATHFAVAPHITFVKTSTDTIPALTATCGRTTQAVPETGILPDWISQQGVHTSTANKENFNASRMRSGARWREHTHTHTHAQTHIHTYTHTQSCLLYTSPSPRD